MSVLSRLTSSLTAQDLQTPTSGRLPGHLTVHEAICESSKPTTSSTGSGALRTLPSRRPWSQTPREAVTSITLIDDHEGVGAGVIDLSVLAKAYIRCFMDDNFEALVSDEWKQPLSALAIPVDGLPHIDISATAFDVATLLGEVEETVLLVFDGETVTGFITFESLQNAAFTLPLFGLLLEVEEAALQWMEINPRECWQLLPPGRRKFAIDRASNEFNKIEQHVISTGQRTIPLETALNLWLLPEETEERLAGEVSESGAPIALALQMTSFIDKCTVLTKAKVIPTMSSKVLKQFWTQAEKVRNCIAHGRSWWLELANPKDLMTFVASAHEMRAQLAAAITRDVEERNSRTQSNEETD